MNTPADYLKEVRHPFTPNSRPAIIRENVGYQISDGKDPFNGRPVYYLAVVRRDYENYEGVESWGKYFHISYDESTLSYDETHILSLANKLQ